MRINNNYIHLNLENPIFVIRIKRNLQSLVLLHEQRYPDVWLLQEFRNQAITLVA